MSIWQNNSISAELLSSVFCDEMEPYRVPAEPDEGDDVTFRLRIAAGWAGRVLLTVHKPSVSFVMNREKNDEYFDWFSAQAVCSNERVRYSFIIEQGEQRILYDRTGAHVLKDNEKPAPETAFGFTPGFHVPQWAKGTVEYQIMPDRFRNGDHSNDVQNNEYFYEIGHSRHIADWNAEIKATNILDFYGGDIQGIIDSLDYLQNLGVETLYLNPVFVSPSSHKYDVQDYDHVDPHLGIITEDISHKMLAWEKHNGFAPRYIKRVCSEENLRQSDALFAKLCNELHERGMKIILDGVFNHCGSFCKWMDRENIYIGRPGYLPGAFQNEDSPYRDYFSFKDEGAGNDYEGWWNYPTLPKLNYEASEKLREEVFSIAEKWASPPYSIDGWRLDVAADLGHSEEFNHSFWREFRRRVKKVNPELIIIAEHYGNPAPWLAGDQWDSVMNYDAFMEPLSFFLTGMDKHSDWFKPELVNDGRAFFSSMLANTANFDTPSVMCAMNQLSNHDHSRFLTRTNRTPGRLETSGSAAAAKGIDKNVFAEAVVVQMTWPGCPAIYYADEAGQVGWTDPDSRRTYPWNREDKNLIELHRELISLRKRCPALINGSMKPLLGMDGVIAFARFTENSFAFTACNNSTQEKKVRLRLRDAGVLDGQKINRVFISGTGEKGFCSSRTSAGEVTDGYIEIILPAVSASVYEKENGNEA